MHFMKLCNMFSSYYLHSILRTNNIVKLLGIVLRIRKPFVLDKMGKYTGEGPVRKSVEIY